MLSSICVCVQNIWEDTDWNKVQSTFGNGYRSSLLA